MPINHWPKQERPREKLLHHGASALSIAELLAICLRTGVKGKSAIDLSRELIQQFGTLYGLLNANEAEFCQLSGVGRAKYVQLQAITELNRRLLFEQLQNQDIFHHPKQVREYLQSKLGHQKREVFACLFLNSQYRVICFEELFHGSIAQADIYPREVIKAALHHNAAAIIIAHNHPSGDPKPSAADEQMTLQLKQALSLVEVKLLDHFIVGYNQMSSLAEMGVL